jgi:ribonuclease HI
VLSINFFQSLFSLKKKQTYIFTDGSHKGKWGSWAFVIVENDKIIYEASGRERYTSSHHMEFRAVEQALKFKIENNLGELTLYSDSREMIKAMRDDPSAMGVSFKWIKAHAGHIYNERCDQLCVLARNAGS